MYVKVPSLKIGGCVVLYNPEIDVLENINTYIDIVEELVVIDNSSVKAEFLKDLVAKKKIKYVFMGGNKGIAAALDRGIRILYEESFDIVLTMDQDSKFPTEGGDVISRILAQNIVQYSIIGLNFNNFVEEKTDIIVDVKHWITSGNFVSVKDYIEVNGFSTELFIDYVDFDLNNKFHKLGKKIGVIKDWSLIHKIGNPIEITVFGRKFYAMNHSSIRYYYRYRNSLYLYLKDESFYRKLFWKEIFISIPKMLLYEPNKIEKLRMIFKGLNDGFNNRLGIYHC